MNIAPGATNGFRLGPKSAVDAAHALFFPPLVRGLFFFLRFFLEKGGSEDGGLLEL